MLVDVHTHVTDPAFDSDRKEIIEQSGCVALINNGYTPQDNEKTIALAKKYSLIKVALGLHPSETKHMSSKDVDNVISFIARHKPFAIGEVGLDGTYENMDQQIAAFKKFIALAIKKDRPIIVHSRKAELLVVDMLEAAGAKKVILHCFSGKLKLAERAEKLGWYFSIPPIIRHSTHFQELVKKISLTRLLTETDAPYLAPEKGTRNEPKNVSVVVETIAEIKGLDPKEAENAIYMNYQRLFF